MKRWTPDRRVIDRLEVLGGALLEPVTQDVLAFLAEFPAGSSARGMAVLLDRRPQDVLSRIEVLMSLALVEERPSVLREVTMTDRMFQLPMGVPRPLVDGLLDFLARPLPLLDERTSTGGENGDGKHL